MAYIYQITNNINGKIYVGKTVKNNIQERWEEHLKDYKKPRCEKRPLYDAMNKYGSENFSIKELEECSAEELNDKEIYWIEKLGSFKYGYNATIGGDGKHYADYDLIYSLFLEGYNCSEIKRLTGYDNFTIRIALDNKSISMEERYRQSRKLNRNGKSVAKIDPITNKIIEIYPSISEAERQNGNSKHIGHVCRGQRKSCKGYFWKYI